LVNIVLRAVLCWKLAVLLKAGWADLVLFRDLAKIALVAATAGAAAWLLRGSLPHLRPFFVLLYSGLLFCLVYGTGILVLRILTPEEENVIARYSRRLLGRAPQLAVTSSGPDR
jgi:hypothetical protein